MDWGGAKWNCTHAVRPCIEGVTLKDTALPSEPASVLNHYWKLGSITRSRCGAGTGAGTEVEADAELWLLLQVWVWLDA